MAKNLAINDSLLREAFLLGERQTEEATVNDALREYIDRRKRVKALDIFGTIDFDPQYEFKADRKKR